MIQEIIKEIDSVVDRFDEKIPGLQRRVFDAINEDLRELDVRNGSIQNSAKNLRLIAQIRNKLEAIFTDAGYTREVAEYLRSFNRVTQLQNRYFTSIESSFTPSELLTEIRTQSITATAKSLAGAGIGVNVLDKIQELLRINVTTGAKFTDLSNALRTYIVGNEEQVGALQRYTKQITTDALNQYAGTYADVVSSDLGLDWFTYTGSLIETSRTFCEALVKKKWIHRSELPAIIKGDFKEFKNMEGKINARTKLPEGMVADTNAANFMVYRGGYNCRHQLAPVSRAVVPKEIRKRFETSLAPSV